LLVDAGVDLLVIETQFDLTEASAAVRAVRAVDGEIPLVCSFSYDRGTRTMMGVRPEAMAETIGALAVDALGINCGRSLEENLQALGQLRQATDKPIWFKPNAGMPEMDEDGKPSYSVSPAEMGALVPGWLAAGAQLVGGCCGTSPEHLAEIAKRASH
jgi:5-methyltetrahydrofolate--homocysteine methyltransferase